jgi:hypothetical protein
MPRHPTNIEPAAVIEALEASNARWPDRSLLIDPDQAVVRQLRQSAP